ncbi:histone acetyl transferase [Podospora conica]|nr:histone acetyl transferase [Schizothecium conicum]
MSDVADDAWTADAKEAFNISIVRAEGAEVKVLHKFHPDHVYSIFGEDEQIYGYQGLDIGLSFSANDMRPNLRVKHTKKLKVPGEDGPTDVAEVLREFLPEVAYQKRKDFETAIHNVPENWTPPGKLLTSFTRGDDIFEVWEGTLADPAVMQLLERIQVFVPLFIEGGTKISTDLSDADRWTVFFLYQKKDVPGQPAQYTFNGYCTTYRFFLMLVPTPPSSPLQTTISDLENLELGKDDFDLTSLPCRSRISQFIILPPFQGRGIGPLLYRAIYERFLHHGPTVEVTVEDPNEAFDDMRDIADLYYLRSLPEFAALHLNTSLVLPSPDGWVPQNIVDPAAAEAVRRKAKMAPRQFARVLEIHLMSRLPDAVRPGIAPPDDERPAGPAATKEQRHELRLWKLIVGQRITRQNKDALGELEIPERIKKLDETVASVAFDYARLLLKAEPYAEFLGGGERGAKRKADEEAEAGMAKRPKSD